MILHHNRIAHFDNCVEHHIKTVILQCLAQKYSIQCSAFKALSLHHHILGFQEYLIGKALMYTKSRE